MSQPLHHSTEQFDDRMDKIGQLLAIFGPITVSFSYMLMRRIAGRMYLMLPPFYLSLTSNVLTMPFALWMYSRQPEPTMYTWSMILLIIGVSVTTLTGQIYTAKAFFHEKAGRVTPVNYAKIIITIALDATLFQQKLHLQEWIGASMIIISTLAISVLKCQGVVI